QEQDEDEPMIQLSSRVRHLAMVLGAAIALAACGDRSPPPPAQEAAAPAEAASRPMLVPLPARLEQREGSFRFDAGVALGAADAAARRVAGHFAGMVAATHGFTPALAGEGAQVRASDERGLFYGAVTLWQLLSSAQGEAVRIPALRIEDAPRFSWRGLMLDSARHFQSVDEIKQLIDAMARHKLNVLHWHLTDDQGWRIEIPKYPKLMEVGGCRIPAGEAGTDPDTGQTRPYCGWYTQDQIRDIVAYAGERHIMVVPEFDMPGHVQAVVAAYPEYGSLGDTPPVSNEWGVHQYLFNVDEDTFAFIEDVLDEIMALFPAPYVHVG